MTILELTESFKIMNRSGRPDTTVTLFDNFFLGKYKSGDMKFWHNLHSTTICVIKIYDRYLW